MKGDEQKKKKGRISDTQPPYSKMQKEEEEGQILRKISEMGNCIFAGIGTIERTRDRQTPNQ